MMAWLELQERVDACIIPGRLMSIPFNPIARILTRTLRKKKDIDLSGLINTPRSSQDGGGSQGILLTVNHYSAPDLRSWWPAILVSASFPQEIHWVVTSEWTNSGCLTGLTRWLFPLGARVFGFSPMPAMPPIPADIERRALAVRHVLNYASHTDYPVVGLAPEGRDFPGGVLGTLPEGVGRFVHHLSRYCQTIVPVGVWEEGDIIHLRYGHPYQLTIVDGLTQDLCDRLVGDTLMNHIAALLPERLRGKHAPDIYAN